MASKKNKCECCEEMCMDVKKRRLNTAYCDDALNFIVSCAKCFDREIEYYQERWDEYYSGRL